MTTQELKALACQIIDDHRSQILQLGDSIFSEPETGWKEFKTAEKIKKVFTSLGFPTKDHQCITGVIAQVKGGESKMKVAVMGELDALGVPDSPFADKETGAAHMCGHHCMIAALSGVAYALHDRRIADALGGDVALMAVPAEEFIEMGYRSQLRRQGKIKMFGGKQEFICRGLMDDVDMMVMQHTTATEGEQQNPVKASVGGTSNGFVSKEVFYVGKAAHAGGAPEMGINALNAAKIGLVAIDAQRETFRDEDHIRVHPIITKGGDTVNVVPADVRIETYVRGASVEAILDASAKVNRALKAGGDAVGAETRIVEIPGYLPMKPCSALQDVMYANLASLLGEKHVARSVPHLGGSTDAADVAALMPTVHAYVGGAAGTAHSKDFHIVDKELAFVTAAKAMVMTVIDLLANGAELGLKIKKDFKPAMTKEEYIEKWCNLK
ncbi:MAG: amidohydrolase [Pyramidobacter sp.]|jgi:amidohydrolase